MRALPSPLLVVTDRTAHARPLAERVAAILAGGARWIWFRERDMPSEARETLARTLLPLVKACGGTLTIGGDPDLAVRLGANGIQLPGGTPPAAVAEIRSQLPDVLIGLSAHSLPEVEAAARMGADYVTLSPIFASPSKPGYGPPLGVEALGRAAAILPVIALGGLTAARARACRDAGASGVAVMGDLMRADESSAGVRALLDAWRP